MAKTTYTVTYDPLLWSCTISIEDQHNGKPTLDVIKEMVEFWSDWEQLLSDNDGDYINAFVQQLARQAFLICAAHNYNTFGVVEEFKDMEGWVAMDGSCGITLVSTDDYDALYSDFLIIKS